MQEQKITAQEQLAQLENEKVCFSDSCYHGVFLLSSAGMTEVHEVDNWSNALSYKLLLSLKQCTLQVLLQSCRHELEKSNCEHKIQKVRNSHAVLHGGFESNLTYFKCT